MGLIFDYFERKSPRFAKHKKKLELIKDILFFLLYLYLLLYARNIILEECRIYDVDLVCYHKNSTLLDSLNLSYDFPVGGNFSLQN